MLDLEKRTTVLIWNIEMKDIEIKKITKRDDEKILLLYLKTYLDQWEDRTRDQIKPFVDYLLKRPFKLKLVHQGKVIGGFISDIKPWHTGSMLFDPELFIDPGYQKQWFWRLLLKTAFEKAKKDYWVSDLISFTFKDSYQLKRYQRLGMKADDYRQMLYGDIDDVIKNLK